MREDCLAGPRLSGDDVEARRELDVRLLDEDEVLDAQAASTESALLEEHVAVAAEERDLGEQARSALSVPTSTSACQGSSSITAWPSTRTVTATSSVRFVTSMPRPGGTTSVRMCSECGATDVTAIASSPRMITGPPLERL